MPPCWMPTSTSSDMYVGSVRSALQLMVMSATAARSARMWFLKSLKILTRRHFLSVLFAGSEASFFFWPRISLHRARMRIASCASSAPSLPRKSAARRALCDLRRRERGLAGEVGQVQRADHAGLSAGEVLGVRVDVAPELCELLKELTGEVGELGARNVFGARVAMVVDVPQGAFH